MRAPLTLRRTLAAGGTAVGALLLLAGPAAGHVTVSPETAPADGYAVLTLTVPHGCGDAPTEEVVVQLPDSLQSVKAEAVPGWAPAYEMADLDEPYELHGTTITEYVDTITWTADGDPLPSDQYLTFGINVRTPDAAGERLLLPTVQRCPGGEESTWIDPDPESEGPAPTVELVAATADGHGSSDTPVSDDAPAELADGGTAGTATDADDGTDLLTIVALLAGLGGLALGGYAAVAARR